MRLLHSQGNGEVCLTRNFLDGDIPEYAILSHTWSPDHEEILFEDFVSHYAASKEGYRKIEFCAKQAARNGLVYFWIDSCCIMKSSSAELSESINSMFRWYSRAARCYVYMSDVSAEEGADPWAEPGFVSAFRRSKWFTRGWTLQELLAPKRVEFFSKEGIFLGDRESLKQKIQAITGLPSQALSGRPLSEFGIEERFGWIAGRETTRKEDIAYCLLGIFNVFIPVIYGEGNYAFTRLKEAVHKSTADETLAEPPSKSSIVSELNIKNKADSALHIVKEVLELLHFDQLEDRQSNIKNSHGNTCEWFLESQEYRNWLDSKQLANHLGLFWVKGKPGGGKSTLIKFALLRIDKSLPNTTVLSFFFSARGSELERSTRGFYRSLLWQLLQNVPEHMCEKVLEIPVLKNANFRNKLPENETFLKDVFRQMLWKTGHRSVTILVDALDECNEDEIRDMLAFFEDLVDTAISLGAEYRLLLASRHYPYITMRKCIHMRLEDQPGHACDIKAYLSSKLLPGFGIGVEDIRQEIATRASGVFMWIVLVVQILNKAYDHGHIHALRRKLQEIPDDLSQLFEDMLTRDAQNLDEMKLCLQWLLFSFRPMTLEELYFAVLFGIEPGKQTVLDAKSTDVERMALFILSCSKGFVEITDSSNRVVQFIHESVREYLLKDLALVRIWPDLKINAVGMSHDRLKDCCVKLIEAETLYLKNAFAFDGLTSEDSTILFKSIIVGEKRHLSVAFPFAEYTVRFLLYHADIAQSTGISQESFLMGFNVSAWVKLGNLVGWDRSLSGTLPNDISLFYVLALMDYASLIGVAMRALPIRLETEGEFENSVYAAIANHSDAALDAITKTEKEMYPDGRSFPFHSDGQHSHMLLHCPRPQRNRLISVYNIGFDFLLYEGTTLFQFACKSKDEKLLRLLLGKGASANAIHPLHGSVLQAALINRDWLIVAILLEHGADVNFQGGYYGSALNAALVTNHIDVVRELLQRGANVNSEGGYFHTPLLTAMAFSNVDVIWELLQWGGDVNAQGGHYGNVLQTAALRGHANIVKELVKRKVNINTKGEYYGTALYAAISNDNLEIAELLLKEGADVNETGLAGTALDEAVRKGCSSSIGLLLSRKDDISDSNKANALSLARTKGHSPIIQLLEDSFANATI